MDIATIAGVILAGGKGSRMQDSDKPLLHLAGKTLIEHVIERARPQVTELIISVNKNLPAYRNLELPLVADGEAPQLGPLVGICSALQWYDSHRSVDSVACFPADVPFFPLDLVTSLRLAKPTTPAGSGYGAKSRDPVIWLRTGDQVQPLFSLWPLTALTAVSRAVARGTYGPRLFFNHYPNIMVQLPAAKPPLFLNINTPDELRQAETLLPSH